MKKINELPKGATMAPELAELELEAWFDYRRVRPRYRNQPDEDLGRDVMREKMVDAFTYGDLVFNPDDGVLTQKLQFPIKKQESEEVVLSELKFKPRLMDRDLIEPMRGVKAKDTDARMKAYISAVTGVPRTVLSSMDYADSSLAQTIINYFLL